MGRAASARLVRGPTHGAGRVRQQLGHPRRPADDRGTRQARAVRRRRDERRPGRRTPSTTAVPPASTALGPSPAARPVPSRPSSASPTTSRTSARSTRFTRTTRCSPTARSTRATRPCPPRRSTSPSARTAAPDRHQRRRLPLPELQGRREEPGQARHQRRAQLHPAVLPPVHPGDRRPTIERLAVRQRPAADRHHRHATGSTASGERPGVRQLGVRLGGRVPPGRRLELPLVSLASERHTVLPPAPVRHEAVTVYTDEHGEANVHYVPGLGLLLRQSRCPQELNGGCDLENIAPIGTADVTVRRAIRTSP